MAAHHTSDPAEKTVLTAVSMNILIFWKVTPYSGYHTVLTVLIKLN
jgi:hypothetical protein